MSGRVRDRSSLLRLKSESPKFRDVMRQRCHRRWRENRWKFVDDRRRLSESFDAASDLVKEDLKAMFLCHTVDPDAELERIEEIENERIDDELSWLIAQYDRILDDEDRLNDMLRELDQVICPICQKNELTVVAGQCIVCDCGLSLKTTLPLLQIKHIITTCVDSHNNSCTSDAQFTAIDENGEKHLFLCCYDCSMLTMML